MGRPGAAAEEVNCARGKVCGFVHGAVVEGGFVGEEDWSWARELAVEEEQKVRKGHGHVAGKYGGLELGETSNEMGGFE